MTPLLCVLVSRPARACRSITHVEKPRMAIARAAASPVNTPISALNDRIRDKQARIGIIGLGYVGLPLAVEFARAGFNVTGFDVDEAKPRQISAGTSYIPDVLSADLAV